MILTPKDVQILQIIVQYCDDIESAVKRFGATQEEFMVDRHYRHACSMALQTIGEVAKSLRNPVETHQGDADVLCAHLPQLD